MTFVTCHNELQRMLRKDMPVKSRSSVLMNLPLPVQAFKERFRYICLCKCHAHCGDALAWDRAPEEYADRARVRPTPGGAMVVDAH